jgi:hypothetical protein
VGRAQLASHPAAKECKAKEHFLKHAYYAIPKQRTRLELFGHQ